MSNAVTLAESLREKLGSAHDATVSIRLSSALEKRLDAAVTQLRDSGLKATRSSLSKVALETFLDELERMPQQAPETEDD